MATSQQKMFNPPSPPYQGGIVLPLIREIGGVAIYINEQRLFKPRTLLLANKSYCSSHRSLTGIFGDFK